MYKTVLSRPAACILSPPSCHDLTQSSDPEGHAGSAPSQSLGQGSRANQNRIVGNVHDPNDPERIVGNVRDPNDPGTKVHREEACI